MAREKRSCRLRSQRMANAWHRVRTMARSTCGRLARPPLQNECCIHNLKADYSYTFVPRPKLREGSFQSSRRAIGTRQTRPREAGFVRSRTPGARVLHLYGPSSGLMLTLARNSHGISRLAFLTSHNEESQRPRRQQTTDRQQCEYPIDLLVSGQYIAIIASLANQPAR